MEFRGVSKSCRNVSEDLKWFKGVSWNLGGFLENLKGFQVDSGVSKSFEGFQGL